MTAHQRHPTHWTAVVSGGVLQPGEHVALRPTRGEAEAFADLYRRAAGETGEPFVFHIIPPGAPR